MRILLPAAIGLALAASAFAFTATPASAIEMRSAAPAISGGATKVSERCERWAHRCRDLYPAGGWRFRRCKAIHGCR